MDDVYDALTDQLRLGPEFGRNLDALWDVLTTEVAGPLDIVWRDSRVSRARLGEQFPRLLWLFRAVADQRGDVTIAVEE